MNRRTILKTIAAAVAAPFVPLLPKAKAVEAAAPLIRVEYSIEGNSGVFGCWHHTIQEALDFIGERGIHGTVSVPGGHVEPSDSLLLENRCGRASAASIRCKGVFRLGNVSVDLNRGSVSLYPAPSSYLDIKPM